MSTFQMHLLQPNVGALSQDTHLPSRGIQVNTELELN